METYSKITFQKPIYFLQELVTQKRRELPIIVRTRDKLESFEQEPIIPEGKILYIEDEIEIEVVKFRVLEFHDESKELSRRGEEFMQLYGEFKGEEFFMPLNCQGRFRFVPYPGRRQRYASVTQIIEDKPRYIKSNDDVMAVPPRGYTADCQQIIPAGTIIEPKQVISSGNGKYLMCLDASKNCYFIRENSIVNFIGVLDDAEYSLADLNKSDILLPAIIQFIPGTISPNEVVLFNDVMASDNLVITSAPLELTGIRRLRMLLAKARQSDERCFVTLLMPMPLCEKFHVQVAEFDLSADKAHYIKQKFGGCRGDNGFIRNKMYVIPIEDTLVCWLQSPRQRSRSVKFIDSSDSDDDYEEPKQTGEPSEEPPPLPVRKPCGISGSLCYEVVLPPQRVIHDKDVLQKLRERAKLGFDKVHSEIKRAAERFKHRRSKQDKSYEDVYIVKQTKRLLPIPNRPLPPLPLDVKGVTSTTTVVNDGETQENYDYVYVAGEPRVVEKNKLLFDNKSTKKAAKVHPVTPFQLKINTGINANNFHEMRRPLERSSSGAIGVTPDLTPPPTPHSAPVSFTRSSDRGQETAASTVEEDKLSNIDTDDFFSYSVSQTVECLRYCGLTDLADLCKEQKLDGEFFKHTDETEVRELLKLSGIQLFKLKKIFKGWRPKFN